MIRDNPLVAPLIAGLSDSMFLLLRSSGKSTPDSSGTFDVTSASSIDEG